MLPDKFVLLIGAVIFSVCLTPLSGHVRRRRDVVRGFSVHSDDSVSATQSPPYYYEEQNRARGYPQTHPPHRGSAVTGRLLPQFAGFVSPAPGPPAPPIRTGEHAPATIFGSVWAAWTHWSTCHQNQQLRVRACNTIRGFRCFGQNRQSRWCRGPPPPTPPPTPPPRNEHINVQVHDGEETVEFFAPVAPPSEVTIYDPLPFVDYETYDPWEADRRLAMWQLYGIPLPYRRPRPRPVAPRVPGDRVISRSNKTVDRAAEAPKSKPQTTTTTTTTTVKPTTKPTTQAPKPTSQAWETFEPLNVFTRKPFDPQTKQQEIENLKNENKPEGPKVLRFGHGSEHGLHSGEWEREEELHENLPVETRGRQQTVRIDENLPVETRGRQQTVRIADQTYMVIVPPVAADRILPETILGIDHPIHVQPQPIVPQPAPKRIDATDSFDSLFDNDNFHSQELLPASDLSESEFEQLRGQPDDQNTHGTFGSGGPERFPSPIVQSGIPPAPPPLPPPIQVVHVDEPDSPLLTEQVLAPERTQPRPTEANRLNRAWENEARVAAPGFAPVPDQFEAVPFPQSVRPSLFHIGNQRPPPSNKQLASQRRQRIFPEAVIAGAPDIPVPGGYGSIGQPPPLAFGQKVSEVPEPPAPEFHDHHGATVVIGPVIYAEAGYQEGPQFQPLAPAVPRGFVRPKVPAAKVASPGSETLLEETDIQSVDSGAGPRPPGVRPPERFAQSPGASAKLTDTSVSNGIRKGPRGPAPRPSFPSINRFQEFAKWSDWSDWGPCKCGSRSRTRSCEYVSSHLIQGCTGASYEIESCEGTFCDRRAAPPGHPIPIIPPNGRPVPPPVNPGGVFLAGEPALRLRKPPNFPSRKLRAGTRLRGLGATVPSGRGARTARLHGSSSETMGSREWLAAG